MTEYRAITETAGMRADADQLAMARLRHSLVAQTAKGGDLLDVACGSGYALPLIARHARSVTGCDLDLENVREAGAALPAGTFRVGNAENPPFPGSSFDTVACLEAIYYFQDWKGFVHAVPRYLRPGGTLVVTWPNPSRPAFNRSPNSTAYPAADEMVTVAGEAGFDGVCFGAFPLDDLTTSGRPWLDAVRRTAVALHLIPRSLRLRMFVKRLLYRRLEPLSDIDLLDDPFAHLVKIAPGESRTFAMLYYIGRTSPAAISSGVYAARAEADG